MNSFQKGDVVIHPEKGVGKVIATDSAPHYPVFVRFNDGSYGNYTPRGSSHVGIKTPKIS